MIWFTADTHFHHNKIIQYCNRPFNNINQMNAAIVERWNGLVGDSDTVYHLGDVGWKITDLHNTVRKLKGRKILIQGNHDRNTNRFYNRTFDEYHKAPIEVRAEGWTIPLWLCHYPEHARTDMFTLCGHVHNSWRSRPWILNVGVDVNDFCPVSEIDVFNHIGAKIEVHGCL